MTPWHQHTAPNHSRVRGEPGEYQNPSKEWENQGSTAALAPTPGFRDPVLDLAVLPGLGTLCQDPQLSQQSLQLRVSQHRGTPQGGGRPPASNSPPRRPGGKLSWGRKEPAGLGVTPRRLERYVAWNLNTGCEVQRKGWGRESAWVRHS